MKKQPVEPDPLGTRPAPVTGDRLPRHDDEAALSRAAAALSIAEQVWVDTPQQQIVIAEIRTYLQAWAKSEEKASAGGRGLSQYSQAGKSAAMRRLKRLLAEALERRGLPVNDFQVVIITLRKRTTVNQLLRQVLKKLGCPHWAQEGVSVDTLLERIESLSARRGMELLVVDEVQHLDLATKDAVAVQDQLKTFLDEGYFPIVFVGDEEAEGFFKRNPKFSVRLGERLKLRPLEPLRDDAQGVKDAIAFKLFCAGLDRQLVKRGAIHRRAGLGSDALIGGLLVASGGHVGRVARMVQVAVKNAVWRGADAIDAYDLSHAVRTFAIENGWISHDPYSSRE